MHFIISDFSHGLRYLMDAYSLFVYEHIVQLPTCKLALVVIMGKARHGMVLSYWPSGPEIP